MLRTFLLVGAGGALGSMLRYATGLLLPRPAPGAFPVATLLVNLAGCLAIGLLAGYGARSTWMTGIGWPLLATGLCGGFTTFSAFALDGIKLYEGGFPFAALAYIVASVAGGLALCLAGYYFSAAHA